jgi:glycosyltransferase involved in cell wall biosynthesis
MKLPLSVAYISKNEEQIIGSSIDSISQIASQIIIVDNFSTDNTINIAKSRGAEVFSEEWKGFTEQKNSALQKCSQPWILLLDCDEIVDNYLKIEIQKIITDNNIGFYSINRKIFYLGKLMKYSWQPDNVVRLVHKNLNPKFVGLMVHEKIETGNYQVNQLKNSIIHYSYKNLTDHFTKTIKYSKLSAESYFQAGRKAKIINLIINPIFAFTNMYFFKLGFLDGWRGLLAAFSSMTGTFLKYAFLMEINHTKNN